MSIVPLQCRLGRAALGWGVRDLARKAKVATRTVMRFEHGDELQQKTVDKLQQTFERAGVLFIPANGGGPGVRLRQE